MVAKQQSRGGRQGGRRCTLAVAQHVALPPVGAASPHMSQGRHAWRHAALPLLLRDRTCNAKLLQREGGMVGGQRAQGSGMQPPALRCATRRQNSTGIAYSAAAPDPAACTTSCPLQSRHTPARPPHLQRLPAKHGRKEEAVRFQRVPALCHDALRNAGRWAGWWGWGWWGGPQADRVGAWACYKRQTKGKRVQPCQAGGELSTTANAGSANVCVCRKDRTCGAPCSPAAGPCGSRTVRRGAPGRCPAALLPALQHVAACFAARPTFGRCGAAGLHACMAGCIHTSFSRRMCTCALSRHA